MVKRYIVGVGNWAMGDDSIGLRMVEHLAQSGLDQGFEAVDLSGSGLRLLNYFVPDTERILLIDTVYAHRTPGEYFFFSPEHVISEKELSQFTTHESDLLKTIYMGKNLGYPIPPLKVMGIEPRSIDQSLNLSPELESRFPEYIQAALQAIHNEDF